VLTAGGATTELPLVRGGRVAWQARAYDEQAGEILSELVLSSDAASGQESVYLPAALPGRNEFVTMLGDEGLAGYGGLSVRLRVPEGLPEQTQLWFFTKDWDHLWRQTRVPLPPDGGVLETVLPLLGRPAEDGWECSGHERPWHALTPGQVRQFGLAILSAAGDDTSFSGRFQLLGTQLVDSVAETEWAPEVTRFDYSPRDVRVGEAVEVTLGLRAPYRDPFDRGSVSLSASFRGPGGRTEVREAFYYEDFVFPEGRVTMPFVPYGPPVFKIRYTPREVEGRSLALPELRFAVAPAAPDYRGFVRVDPRDRRFFRYENGEVFDGLGMNVRSPYDNRYVENAPYSLWEDENLALYPRLFERYSRCGIRVVEVWMSSWWMALEWIADAPGNHGVGYMNPYRAWMMDRTLQWAEENGIYLILVFNNHGKFGTTFDTEWDRNPFNVRNGGYLEDCEDYFSDERARDDFRRFLRYVLARWSHSPHIFSWKLFTEIDLTGNSLQFYRKPVMRDWHREMTEYLHENDTYDHMVTTHWMLGFHQINDAVAELAGLDFLTTDAYYMQGGTPETLKLIDGAVMYARGKDKPLLITEFGGSPYGASMGDLIKQLHVGMWAGYFAGSALAPVYWWFSLVEDKGLYGEYEVLSAFAQDVDRRGMRDTQGRAEGDGAVLWRTLSDSGQYLIWAFDSSYYFDPRENLTPRVCENVRVPLRLPGSGAWDVEFWDLRTGSRTTVPLESAGGPRSVALPAFRGDIALKIRRRGE
jgi:hypothetical protein